jgi:hypothetical protein
MARLYFLSAITSDLSGGDDFNLEILPNITTTASALSVSIAAGATEISYGYAEPLDPGLAGSVTGDYTVSVDVTTLNSNINMSFAVARVNSSGTQQTLSSTSGEVSFSTTGAKTLTLTGVDLGTFTSTDRLRVSYRFRNGAAHTAQTFGINRNSVDSYVSAPFNVKYFVTT